MPRIPTRSSPRGTPSTETGLTRLPLSIADTGGGIEARALGQLGQGIASFGSSLGQIEQERQKMRNLSAVSDAEYRYERFQREYEKLADTTEFPDQKSFDAWRTNYLEAIQEKEKELLQGQNRRVQQRLGIAFNDKRASYIDRMDSIILKQERQTYALKVPAQISYEMQDHYDRFKNEYAVADAENNQEAKQALDSILKDKVDTMVARNAHWFDEGQLQRIAVEQHAEVLSQMGRADEAKKLIDSSDLFKATEKTTMKAGVDTASKAVSDVMEKQLSDLYLRGELNTKEIAIRSERMTASAQKSWTQIMLNQHSEGNPFLAAELNQKALGIWDGSTTMEEFVQEARMAAAAPKGINGTEYKSVMNQAATELKQGQAAAIRSKTTEARRVLVDAGTTDPFAFFSGLSGGDKEKAIEKNHLQNWHVSQYARELTEYVREHPDVDSKTFEQFSESKLYEYINRTDEQVRATFAERQTVISQQIDWNDVAEHPDKYSDEILTKAMQRVDADQKTK